MTLVDPVPLHVDQARTSGVSSAVVGDARSLVFDDGSFDAVLMLGPLYHLTDREDRMCALRELHAGFLVDDRFERIVQTDLATDVTTM